MLKPEFIYRARCVSVYDGDTMRADIDLGFHTWVMDRAVRLYGINTPEVRGKEREEGLRVRDLVREWLPSGIGFTLHSIEDRSGKYGRVLGMVYPDGWETSVNAFLYQEGHAKLEAYSESEREMIEALLS